MSAIKSSEDIISLFNPKVKNSNIDSTQSTLNGSTIFQIDSYRKQKEVSKTGDGIDVEELLSYLRTATAITEQISQTVKSRGQVAYDDNTNEIQELKEELKGAKKTMNSIQTSFNIFKYYTAIWTICAFLFGIFITAGISGLLGPFSSFTGVVMSITGVTAVFIDKKDREKKNVQ